MEDLVRRIDYCKLQANWHFAEYQKLKHYILYYEGFLQQQKNHLNHGYGINCSQIQNELQCVNTVPHKIEESRFEGVTSRKRKKKKRKTKTASEEVVLTTGASLNNENYDENYELDSKFCEFLKQSAEFRKERDSKKQNIINNEFGKTSVQGKEDEIRMDVEYVDLMQKGPDGSILPPTASTRKELYEKKYGTKGTAVLSLETALQWKYNKFVDTHSPSPWPSLQLRFT